MKMEAASSFDTSTHNYFATQRLMSEEDTLIVIAVRASNIAEEVVLAFSSYYIGFKWKLSTSHE
jgi:archaellum biogenesis ATPase FlaH